MLTLEQFEANLKEFVDLYSKTDAETIFKLYKGDRFTYAEQRQLIEKNGKRAYRMISIVYNQAYSAPVLWFNFYDSTNGTLLYLEDFEQFISTDSTSTEILKGLSQNEHPVHGIAFYNIHPCKTADFIQQFITCNRIISWLSVYGAILGLDVNNVIRNAF